MVLYFERAQISYHLVIDKGYITFKKIEITF